jgi:phage replication-related protein YjqB (UPF0714/DUF867 family)
MPTYDAQFLPNSCLPDGHIREHCSAQRDQITTIGRKKGQQVRVERYTPDGLTLLDFALYTIVTVHEEEPNLVFVGYSEPEAKKHDLRDRLGLSGVEPFTGKVNAQVTDVEVIENSGFVERLSDNGQHRGLIAIAPHGGAIEPHTNEQAEHVGERLASKSISVWVCQGFRKGGKAFDHLHITSTDISPESFPKLKTVITRDFAYAVAFHGWNEDFICIGGGAPAGLKEHIKTAILNIPDFNIEVRTDLEDCPEGFNGNNPRNIVNRLGANGIHIEQSNTARARFCRAIAEAVADVLGPKISGGC